MTIAILAVQGAFAEHAAMLDRLSAEHFEIRQKSDLDRPFDGLILPGGESTVMNKLLRELELYEPLKAQIEGGLPVFGTCAGLILLADRVEGGVPCFGGMDITARRNAYGRQLGSFRVEERFGEEDGVPMVFIRAPYIVEAGQGVEILARTGGHIVAARQGNRLVTAFHPELTEDTRVHARFLEMAAARRKAVKGA